MGVVEEKLTFCIVGIIGTVDTVHDAPEHSRELFVARSTESLVATRCHCFSLFVVVAPAAPGSIRLVDPYPFGIGSEWERQC
jgi:hypothetical protein